MLIIILSFYLHVNFLTIRKLCIHDPLVFPFPVMYFHPYFHLFPYIFLMSRIGISCYNFPFFSLPFLWKTVIISSIL